MLILKTPQCDEQCFSLFCSDSKTIVNQEGLCKSFLEIMEGYVTTREHENKPGFSNGAPLFDPKQFKANKEVTGIPSTTVIHV